jgi:hypothetical protein
MDTLRHIDEHIGALINETEFFYRRDYDRIMPRIVNSNIPDVRTKRWEAYMMLRHELRKACQELRRFYMHGSKNSRLFSLRFANRREALGRLIERARQILLQFLELTAGPERVKIRDFWW